VNVSLVSSSLARRTTIYFGTTAVSFHIFRGSFICSAQLSATETALLNNPRNSEYKEVNNLIGRKGGIMLFMLILPTTDRTWTDPDANQGLRGERPTTKHLSHGTARGYSFLTSALDGVRAQRHAPAALNPRAKNSQYPLDRRLGGLQSRSGHRG
jgi:hypothetical protein